MASHPFSLLETFYLRRFRHYPFQLFRRQDELVVGVDENDEGHDASEDDPQDVLVDQDVRLVRVELRVHPGHGPGVRGRGKQSYWITKGLYCIFNN